MQTIWDHANYTQKHSRIEDRTCSLLSVGRQHQPLHTSPSVQHKCVYSHDSLVCVGIYFNSPLAFSIKPHLSPFCCWWMWQCWALLDPTGVAHLWASWHTTYQELLTQPVLLSLGHRVLLLSWSCLHATLQVWLPCKYQSETRSVVLLEICFGLKTTF